MLTSGLIVQDKLAANRKARSLAAGAEAAEPIVGTDL